MISKIFAAILSTLLMSANAPAEESGPPQGAGARYSFHQVADGFLRLDSQTGAVALCSQQPVGWACLVAPEDRATFESEIARLRQENAALRQIVLSHGLPLPPATMPGPQADNGGDRVILRLPDNADLDRAIAFVTRAWHSLVAAIASAQNYLLHKS
jgi:hypothetical protein